jgi:tRNA threonylcarbamoyladenosine biosynthesis protein TsaE
VKTYSESETKQFGKNLGKHLRKGDVVSLVGELGTGKTCLVKGIAEGLEVKECVDSPTFIIIKEYKGNIPLYHIDLYRINRLEEIYLLGYEEYIYGESGVSVIEWGDKIRELLPEEHLEIKLFWICEEVRLLRVEAKGNRFCKILKLL